MIDECKNTSIFVGLGWSWVRTRQLEGVFPDDKMAGVWPINFMRVLRGWGEVDGWDRSGDWPPPDASKLDHIAKAKCIDSYCRIWNFDDCQYAFARESAPSASFFVTEKWKNPPEGRLDFNQDHLPILGGHCMGINPPFFFAPSPIDWKEGEFLVSNNSWGEDWGNCGWAAITREFFNRYMYSAWSIDGAVRMPALYGSGVQHIEWKRMESPERVLYAYDIVDMDAKDRLAWCLIAHRRGELHIEDLYVKPEHRGKGYGARMMEAVLTFATKMQPPRFWIDFADVDTPAKAEQIRAWFARFGLQIAKSPMPWAAYTATVGSPVSVLPEVDLPPRPAYVFLEKTDEVISERRLEELRQQYGVSHDFKGFVRQTLDEHADLLQRLA